MLNSLRLLSMSLCLTESSMAYAPHIRSKASALRPMAARHLAFSLINLSAGIRWLVAERLSSKDSCSLYRPSLPSI